MHIFLQHTFYSKYWHWLHSIMFGSRLVKTPAIFSSKRVGTLCWPGDKQSACCKADVTPAILSRICDACQSCIEYNNSLFQKRVASLYAITQRATPPVTLARVPANLENLQLSLNFVNLQKSGKSVGIWDMVREFFVTSHMVHDLLMDELMFACNV